MLPPLQKRRNNIMAKEVWVDKEECISCGLCVDNLPDVFRYDDNGKAEAYNSSGASEDEIESEAIDQCPVGCIHWKE
jgi:ferredoxin